MKKITTIILFFILFASPALANQLKAIFEQATIAYSNGKTDEAIKLFERTLEIYPNFAPSYLFLGLSYKDKGKTLEELKFYFQKAIEINPKYAQAYHNLAKTHYELGEFTDAEHNNLKALEFQPDLLPARLSLAWTYLLGQSEPGQAITHFEHIIEQEQLPYAYLGLGIAYFMDGQKPLVLDVITQLKRLGKEDVAEQLEVMARSENYVPPQIAGAPLITPQQRRKSMIVPDEIPDFISDDTGGMQVMLRDRAPKISPSTNNYKNSSSNYSTGADRIRSLQSSSSPQQKGSGY